MTEQDDRIWLRGDPDIEVRCRRAANARRLKLRVSRLDGRVTVSAPPRVAAATVRAFVETKAEWVRRQLDQCPAEVLAEPGEAIPVEGRLCPIALGAVAAPRLDRGALVISDRKPARPQIAAFLKTRARDRLMAVCTAHAATIGVPFRRLTLRDTRSRWGSCTSAGNLMFSWRLVMAAPDVLDYVAAHEVAHLREMNHSAAFWNLVEELRPDYAIQRRWLRDHGCELHRFRFAS